MGAAEILKAKMSVRNGMSFFMACCVGGIVSVGAQKATVGSSHGRKEAHFVFSSFGFFLTISLTNSSALAILGFQILAFSTPLVAAIFHHA